MNNSNELSTKLVQSLPTECSQAVAKYGKQYALFLDKYPTLQNRTDTITSVYDSVARGGMSFVEIDKYFKDGASEFWIKIMLIDLFNKSRAAALLRSVSVTSVKEVMV